MKEEKKESPIGVLWGWGKPYHGKFIGSIILAVLGVACQMVPYFCVAHIVTLMLSGEQDFSSYMTACIVALCGYLGKVVFANLSTVISHTATYYTLRDLRENITAKLARVPMGTILDTPSGQYKTTIVDRVEGMEPTFAHLIPEMTANVLVPIVIVVYLLILDWRMALLSLVTLVVGLVVMSAGMKNYPVKWEGAVKAGKQMTDAIVEYIGGIEVVKAFSQSAGSYKKYSDAVNYNANYYVDWMRENQKTMSAYNAILPSVLICVLPCGFSFWLSGSLELSTFLSIVIFSLGLVGPIIAAFTFTDDLAVLGTNVEEISQLLNAEELNHKETPIKLENTGISLRSVSFSYDGTTEVLHDVNLAIHPGTMTALVGPSGSGKSTVAKLIAGYWDVTSGSITLGGHELKDMPLSEIADQISYVSQDNYLFNRSIRENIRMGRPSATDAEVEQAAKQSGCDAFIRKLDNGYDKAAILHIMSEAEGEGHLYLKREDIIERVEKLLNHNKDVSPVSERAIRDTGNDMIHTDGSLVCHDGGFYTRKSFQAELGAAAALVRLHMQTGMAVNVDRILRKIQKEQDIILNAKQQVAVKNVFENPVSIITGGPGRGKTTVIRFIIAVQEALDKNAVILLCAPTGIARRRMRECTEYPAMTIHKSIGLTGEAGEEEWKNEQPIPDDLIIADEFSMVDMYLADKLFASIKSGARLVLVGDKDQIESVGPGKVFQEIIDSGVFPVTVLDECFRQEGNSTISQNAIKINKNQLDLVFDDTFQFIPASTPEEASQKIQKIYRKEVLQRNGSLEEVQVMSPLRKDTEAGTDALNLVLRDIANPKRFGYPEITNGRNTYREGDRVMQTKNNDEVANGDIGEVIGIFRKDQKMVMRVDFGDGRVMEYQEEDYWPLTLAYAITVHKAQGSEYPMAILPMLPCFRWMLRRNIFYTAVTRARERFIIVGSKRAIAQAIRTDYISRRNTMFGYRIRKIYEAILEQEKSA